MFLVRVGHGKALQWHVSNGKQHDVPQQDKQKTHRGGAPLSPLCNVERAGYDCELCAASVGTRELLAGSGRTGLSVERSAGRLGLPAIRI